jgi:hypothetical protein
VAYAAIPFLTASSDTVFSLTASFTERLRINPGLLLSGHKYFFIATAQMSVSSNMWVGSQLVYQGVVLNGARNSFHANGITLYKSVFACGFLDGDSVSSLSFQFAVTSGYAGRATRLRLLAIDLTGIPNSNVGWTEFSSSSVCLLNGSWQKQWGFTFTPDGVSDYLFVGSMEFSGVKWNLLAVHMYSLVAVTQN